MTDTFLTLADKALDLAADAGIMKAFGWTVSEFSEIHKQLAWAQKAEDLLVNLVDSAHAPQIKAVFDALDNGAGTYDTLSKAITSLQAAEADVPEVVRQLLQPVSSFVPGDTKGRIAWKVPLFKANPVKSSTYSLALNASAELDFDAGAIWPDDKKAGRRLGIAATGKAAANASGKAPYASVSAGTSAGLALTWLFQVADEDMYAKALADGLNGIVNPFDLTSVWNGMSGKLDGLIYSYTGATKVQASITVADTVTLGTNAVVSLGTTFSVDIGLNNTYALTLRRNRGGDGTVALDISLSRGKADTTTLSSSVDVGIDLSSVLAPVSRAVQQAAGQWNTDFAALLPYLSPGTLLRNALTTEVGKLVKDPTLRAAILADLGTALGTGATTDSALIGWVSDEIAGAVDGASALVTNQANTAVAMALGGLAARTPALSAAASSKLEGIISTAITNADADLKARVKAIFTTSGADFARKLNAAGIVVGKKLDTLDNQLAAVRDILGKIDTQIKAIAKVAADAASQKLKASITSTQVSASGNTIEIKGRLINAGEGARKVFDALVSGDMKVLTALFDAGATATGDFTLDRAASSITRYSNVSATKGVDVVFLNFGLGGSELITANATAKIDGLGNVRIDSSDNLKKVTKAPGNTRTAYFVDGFTLAYAGAATASRTTNPPVIEIGIGATYDDKSLTWQNVKGFVKGLYDAGLVAATTPDAARDVFNRWSAASGSGSIDGSLAAALRLNGPDIQKLLRLSDDDIGKLQQSPGVLPAPLSRDARIAIAAAGLEALQHTGAVLKADFDRGLAIAIDYYQHKSKPTPLDYVIEYNDIERNCWPTDPKNLGVPNLYLNPNEQNLTNADFDGDITRHEYVLYARAAFILNRLIELIQRLRDLYTSQKASPAWTVDTYREAQAEVAQLCSYWLTIYQSIASMFESNITPYTIAFLRVMMALSGHAGIELTLTHTPAQGPAETVTLH